MTRGWIKTSTANHPNSWDTEESGEIRFASRKDAKIAEVILNSLLLAIEEHEQYIRTLLDEINRLTTERAKLHSELRSSPAVPLGYRLVPEEIDRSKHGHVLLVWNDCMIEHETLEMTWPKLIEAMLFAASEEA